VRFCSEPACNGVAPEGRFCSKHTADNYERRRDRHRENPTTRSWYGLACWKSPTRGLRFWKLCQDPMCEEIDDDSLPCRRHATDVHHKDGSWREGGPGAWSKFMDRKNLKSLCHEHHSAITAKEHLNQ
jgi:hypothetical protein